MTQILYGVSIVSYAIALIVCFKGSKLEVVAKPLGTACILGVLVINNDPSMAGYVYYTAAIYISVVADFFLAINKQLNGDKKQLLTITGTSMFLIAYIMYIIGTVIVIKKITLNISLFIIVTGFSSFITLLHRMTLHIDQVTKRLVNIYMIQLSLMMSVGIYCILIDFTVIGWGLVFLTISDHVTGQQWWGRSISEYKFKPLATSSYVIGQILLSLGFLGVSII